MTRKMAALEKIATCGVAREDTWRHTTTGGLYRIITVAIDEVTLEPVVVYRGIDGVDWTRTLDVFLSGIPGYPDVRRFVKV